MKKTGTRVLSVNVGSSSIKFALFDGPGKPELVSSGAIERIGLGKSVFRVKDAAAPADFLRPVKAQNHAQALAVLLDWAEAAASDGGLLAIGHRVVHGGTSFSAPQIVTTKMLAKLREFSAYDPEHMPEEIAAIEAFRKRFPKVPQVACFDTAFHHDLPRVAKILPIPRQYEKQGMRRYGFHGLSYQFLMEELARTAGVRAARGRVILAHLGSGASLAAVDGGLSIDTSMGFTPAGGVPMSTRSGDLDPGVLVHLSRAFGMDAEQLNDMVNFRSGLLGVSETSADMKELLMAAARDERCAEAVAVFCYQVKKTIGAYAAALGGLDTLVFAGGIGENAPAIRAIVCDGLEFLGIKLSESKNAAGDALISAKGSRVAVRVIHTNEEFMIARSVGRAFNAKN
jgi:acetate kinase